MANSSAGCANCHINLSPIFTVDTTWYWCQSKLQWLNWQLSARKTLTLTLTLTLNLKDIAPLLTHWNNILLALNRRTIVSGCTFYFTNGDTRNEPGHHFSMKMSSYHYRNSHDKDKTVPWPSCLHNGNSYIWKDVCLCLTAPSHYLNQCWLITSKVLWHSSEDIIIRRFEDSNQ